MVTNDDDNDNHNDDNDDNNFISFHLFSPQHHPKF